MSVVQKLSNYLFTHGLVDEEDLPWVEYGLEKRMSTLISFVPIWVLAIKLSGLTGAISFLSAFSVLRSVANGYHAKTLLGCFLFSTSSEIFFLRVIFQHLTPSLAVVLLMISSLVLIFFAPYNHPNIHLSDIEMKACCICLRKRLSFAILVIGVSIPLQLHDITYGVTTGIAMTAFLLCLAYIQKWRNKNESKKSNT